MPVDVSIWRIGQKLERLQFEPMPTEGRLETLLAADISIVDTNLLLIGRQVPTAHGKFVDLLAMDPDGKLTIFELKRDRTPREVVAQLLDYGSWVRGLDNDDVAAIFANYLQKYHPDHAGASLDQAFRERFQVKDVPESWNEGHELVVIASELDPSTERIVNYLAEEYGVSINVVFFRFFRDGDREYLSRAWLIDPAEVETAVTENRGELAWNGEYYVSFGEGPHRNWEDARKYGFICGGGGSWYSQTLRQLEPGARIWVNVPGQGYVGVGRVVAPVVPLDEFLVPGNNGQDVPITSMPLKAPNMNDPTRTPEEREHLVRVKWLKTVPLNEAIKEKGFFGNQNIVAKPKNKKWQHTIDRLKTRFHVSDDA